MKDKKDEAKNIKEQFVDSGEFGKMQKKLDSIRKPDAINDLIAYLLFK